MNDREVDIYRMNIKFGEDNQKLTLLPFTFEIKIVLSIGSFTDLEKSDFLSFMTPG